MRASTRRRLALISPENLSYRRQGKPSTASQTETREHRLPDVPLARARECARRARARAVVHLLDRRADLARTAARSRATSCQSSGRGARARRALKRRVVVVRVRVVVDVDGRVAREGDGVGARRERARVEARRGRRRATRGSPTRPSSRRTRRARHPAPSPRKRFSIAGTSSVQIASPYGPSVAELTAYESSKSGTGWLIVAISMRCAPANAPPARAVQFVYSATRLLLHAA